ncbi:hypothetical protein FE257_003498 [Aspergillus nanangensis]|uniref:Nephrocystin 3-like N-terminal domain-containing protein n=1 Tax=Aspergillus nanangensis TaxID=2582783 RepID=A0AAD4CBI0_ASPNN|nr:hypothetical protein FE257_003498 [Aspergillus nanangensis]
MAPSTLSPVPSTVLGPFSPGSRQVSGFFDSDKISNAGMSNSFMSRRVSSRKFNRVETTHISSVVSFLKSRSGDELGHATTAQFANASHDSLLDWIRSQRMSLLPAEGSDYDKVLAWAQLFVERLNSFDLAIEDFAGDSYLATQLAYGYCAMLLEVGQENAPALMISFGFFYSTSMILVNLLERVELFTVNQEIREQLVLALGDLVTLVASVSTHFHKAINKLSGASVSINLFHTFGPQIKTFRQRCENIALSMWKHQLLREHVGGDRVTDVQTIRSWLSADDRVLSNIAESTSHLAHEREELTCLWVGPYLTRFLKSNFRSLCIAGKPGSGKTVLSSVIVDHLQHPIGGVSYNTLFIPVNARIPAEASARAIARTILCQLFEKRIGNVQLFQILSDAYETSKRTTTEGEYDTILWTALGNALAAALQGAKDLVLVVDGVDEASCGETDLMQKLTAVTSKGTNVRLIALTGQKPPAAERQACVQITEDLVFDDISAVVRRQLNVKTCAFQTMSELDQETIASRITEASGGSFLWAKLAVKQVRQEGKVEGFRKAVDTIVSVKPSVGEFVLQLVQNPAVSAESKQLLLWLATVERPLQIRELGIIASIRVDKQLVVEQDVDVLDVLHPVKSLVFVMDGLVYIRHGLMREAILDVFSKGKLLPNVKDRHAELVTRLLVYIKSSVNEKREISLTSMDSHDANILLDKHHLLDFALRYWPLHFRQTSVFAKDGRVGASKEFGKLLPASTAVVLLQNAVWERLPTWVLLFYRTVIASVCTEILTVKNEVTLQSIIFLAQLYRQLGKTIEAAPLFYQAASISSSLLTNRHGVTMQLTSAFLDLTVSQITASKTDVMVQREECFSILIECYKMHYGTTSEKVVSVMKQLSEHYYTIREEQKAEELLVSIKALTETEYDKVTQETGNLNVRLTGRQERNDVEHGNALVLTIEHDEAIESHDFEASMQMAEQYAAEGRFELAERTYVEVWQRVTMEYHSQSSSYSEERRMKSVLGYSKFLQSQKRSSEVSSVLSSFWQDSQHTSIASDSSASQFCGIGQVMKEVGLSSMALAVFRNCADYYQKTNSTAVFQELQQSIQSTSKQVMESVSSVTTVTSETVLEEMVFESSSSITTFDQTSFRTTENLLELYVSQHRWRDATRVIKKILNGIWPSLFAPSLEDVSLPAKDVANCVSLATRLCQSYHSRRRLTKEQDLRVRIYRALRGGRNLEDKLRQQATTELLHLLEYASQTDVIISIRQELLDDYIQHYGPDHPVVVKELWTLAELTRPRPIFIDYYQQIIQKLNKGSATCHPDAVKPLVIVATELWNQTRYSDALNQYRVLFQTFLQQDKSSAKFKEVEFVQEIFDRYTHCLRSVRTEFTAIHKATVEYQTKCKSLFTMSASVTIQATLTLAKLCQESKRYEVEAIALYEELLKTKSEILNLQEISSTLENIYEEQAAILFSSSAQQTISSTQVQRTVQVLQKRISKVRETYGWAHEESLSKMEEMVSLHMKLNQTETAVQELYTATVQVLASEDSSTTLSNAACSIASSYMNIGKTEKVTELVEEIYRQVILRDTSNVSKAKFDLSAKRHQSLVFLAQLRYSLQGRVSSVTEILASLFNEYVYFEEFRKQIKSKSSTLHSVTLSTTRLHQFLLSNSRQSIASRVFDDYKKYFLATEGKRIKLTESAQVTIFLQSILEYFTTHRSHNFVRSIGILANHRVTQLLQAQKPTEASDLALACFKYISAQESYRSPAIVRFIFTLGMTISGRGLPLVNPANTQKKLLDTSALILQHALTVIRDLKIDLTQLDLSHLNDLIALLGAQQDHPTLSWLLTILWNSQKVQHTWRPSLTLALGRRFIMARYLVGDAMAALRLAEDVVYNCRRVHGSRHPHTLEMSTLLSQLYTGVAQKYQGHKDGQELAKRYYKKSAALHENILRAFGDPATAELEFGMDSSNSVTMDGSTFDYDMGASSPVGNVSPGEQVRHHLKLLKLAVERLGDWPKEYGEYERLNADLVREFPDDLSAVDSVEKWDLKAFGAGKAESNEDQVDLQFGDWRLFDTGVGDGVDEEEL